MTFDEKLKNLPSSPGVYLMYDDSGQVIYVGKAVSLKNRVRQYFNNSVKLPKVQAMVDNVADFGYILTLTEKDALSLEANLVKKYYPRYNILLKDDRHSPYIRIDIKEKFPAVEVTRKIKKDGAKYFGPYFSGIRVNDIVDIIRAAYKMRACPKKMPKRECLHYHINMCLAPCCGRVAVEEYQKTVEKVVAFLSGKDSSAEALLNQKMAAAVDAEQFERAIEYRDRLGMLKLLKERNISGTGTPMDVDAVAFVTDGMYGAITVNIIRGSKMMGVKNYSVSDASMTAEDSISSFAAQYYSGESGGDIPAEILFNVEFDTAALREYLSAVKGGGLVLCVPQKGIKRKLTLMAEKNAAEYLDTSVERFKHKQDMTSGAAERLKSLLGIRSARRIECYDISNISGTDKVASGVVFIDGEPSKKDYRRYKIKTVEGADDFASLRETLTRRLSGDTPPPDLFVIDGGKGQLSAVSGIIREHCGTPVISLAEKDELIFTENSPLPIALSKSDFALRLLVRVRDEAHRFAINYHRTLRNRRLDSELKKIAGVGARKLEKLNKNLTFKEIKTLGAGEIAARAGIDKTTARNIENFYKGQGGIDDNSSGD